jgi:hypothetical protein
LRVCVCTIGSNPDNLEKREKFLALVAQDAVGEHQPVDDPEAADALLFVDVHHHYEQPLLPFVRGHELVRRFPGKAFVYDERDVPIFTLPGIYVSARRRSLHHRSILSGPYDHVLNSVVPSPEAPELLFSFQGANCHAVRDAVLGLSHSRAIVRDTGGVDFFRAREMGPERLARAREEYANLMGRSKFVLCPRGRGPTSFRLFETLMAERVPVVISDDWLPPPRIDWDRCIVRVAERDIARVPALLEGFEASWPDLVAAGREQYGAHLAPDRLWHHFCTSIETLARHRPRFTPPWWMQEEVARVGARRVRRLVRGAPA